MTYLVIEGWFADEYALEWLMQIAVLNSRLFLLLAICLLLVHYFKGSAAKRHFILVAAFLAAALLPFSTQWIPAFELIIDVVRPINMAESIGETGPPSIIFAPSSQTQNVIVYFVFLYFSISTFFLWRILASNFAIARLVGRSSEQALRTWNNSLSDCIQSLNIRQNIEIRHSTYISSPMTWGFARSVILIPSDAIHWPEDLRRSALLHELAHIKRRDCLSKQFARLVCAIYWINPLCWLALRQFSHYAESASDDMALNSGLKLSHYAENLLNVAIYVNRQQNHWTTAALSMVGLPLVDKDVLCSKVDSRNQLGLRISAILDPYGCRAPINWFYLTLTFFLVLGCLLPLSSFKANIVQRVTYVMANPQQAIPVHPLSKPEKNTPVIESDIDFIALDNQIEAQLQFQRELKRAVQSPPNVPPLPTPELIEMPARLVIEEAKKKVQQTFAGLKTDKKEQETPEQTKKKQLAENVAIDEIKAIDIAAVMGTDQAIDSLNQTKLSPTTIETQIEPYIPQLVVTPNYPRRAQSRGIEGELLVEFDIDSAGNVTAAKIIDAQPSGVFDRAVLKAVHQNRYVPQKIDGKAVAVSGVQEKYVFVLES